MADAVGERRDRHLRFVDLEDGEVGGRIAAGERRGDRRAVGERDRDVFLALDGVMRGDDDAGSPVDAARGDASPGVDRDDGLSRALDGAGEVVGEGFEDAARGWRGGRWSSHGISRVRGVASFRAPT